MACGVGGGPGSAAAATAASPVSVLSVSEGNPSQATDDARAILVRAMKSWFLSRSSQPTRFPSASPWYRSWTAWRPVLDREAQDARHRAFETRLVDPAPAERHRACLSVRASSTAAASAAADRACE